MKHLNKFNENESNKDYNQIVYNYSEMISDWLYKNEDDIQPLIDKLEDLKLIIDDFKSEDIPSDKEFKITLGNYSEMSFLSSVIKGDIKLDEIIKGLYSIIGE